MLAYNGLALITEKLQNQRLEEASTANTAPSNNNNNCSSNSSSGGGGSNAGSNNSNCSSNSNNNNNIAPSGGCCPSGKLPQVTPDNQTSRASTQSNLTVKGKNVWALSLESERHVVLEMGPPDGKSSPAGGQRALHAPAHTAICRHRKLRHMCHVCCDGGGLNTLTAPPKKKHCRSLSVPPPPAGVEASVSLPAPGKDAKIWRPIAVIPLHNSPADTSNNNTSSSSFSTVPANCPPNLLGRQPQQADWAATLNTNIPGNNTLPSSSSIHPCFPESSACGGSGTTSSSSSSSQWLPKLPPGHHQQLLSRPSSSSLPSMPSPPSVDSGHFTTSDLQTPPGSPVPRPASAASSDVSSFSSLSSPWLECSPHRSTRVRVLENRSLSLEDRISASSALSSAPSCRSDCLVDSSSPSAPHQRCRSSCSLHGGGGVADGCGQSCDVSGVTCGGGGVIPRCHSQPCVLHHRRYGKKRRRDCDNRPNLNFNKMTETAYTHHMATRSHHRRSEPWNTTVTDMQLQPAMSVPVLGRSSSQYISQSSRPPAFCLNSIASSPLDCELPPVSPHLLPHTPRHPPAALDVEPASVSLPLTPPEQASPAMPHSNRRGSPISCEEEEEDIDEDPGQQDCGCHDSRTADGVGLFPMNDLDLDQIESH